MTATVWLLIATVILPLSYFVWTAISVDRVSDRLIRSRLSAAAGHHSEVAADAPHRLATVGRRLTPGAYVARLDRLLANAGRPASMPLDRLLTLKPVAAVGCALLAIVLGAARSPQGALFTLGLTAACYFLPDLLTYNNGTKRQSRIRLDLPNILDQLLISVEAGLGFESALARAGASGKGPLAEELVRTLQDIQAGRTRREAYQAMSERSTVPELRSFVAAIIQADMQGLSIARVLAPQAEQMRIKRRLRAEEKAMKLPVAVVFPLLLFIFPTLFIVILGPAVLNAISTFSGR